MARFELLRAAGGSWLGDGDSLLWALPGQVPTLTVGTPVDGAGAHVTSPPAGTVEGNLLVCYCWLDINTSTVATPATWTLLHGPIDSAGTADCRLYVFAKLAGAGEGSTTFTDALGGRNWTSVIVGVNGNITTALGTGAGDGAVDRTATSTPAADTLVTTATITPTVNSCLIIASAHGDLSATSTPHWTPPGGWTEDLDRENATSFVTGTVAHIDQATAAAISAQLTAAVSDEHVAHIIAVAPGAGGGGQTVAVGHAIETETAPAVGKLKTRATAEAVEVEAAQAITPRKARALTGATEVEAAQALGRLKSRAVGEAIEAEAGQAITVDQPGPQIIPVTQAVEAEAAQAIVPRKTRSLSHAVELESGQALGRAKTRAVGHATETEAGQALGRAKSRAVTQASEPEAGQVIGRRKTAPLSPAVEAETAPTINLLGVQIIPVGRAIETETAPAIGRGKLRALGHAAETEAGQALARLKLATIGTALETEAALVVAVAGGLPPPRWVEGAGGGSGGIEAAAGGGGQVEQVGSGSGVIEATGGV